MFIPKEKPNHVKALHTVASYAIALRCVMWKFILKISALSHNLSSDDVAHEETLSNLNKRIVFLGLIITVRCYWASEL